MMREQNKHRYESDNAGREKESPVMSEQEITRKGNPRKPQGEEGRLMLERMNDSHGAVTSWALEFFTFRGDEEVLDIGCGGGATLARLSEKITSGHLTGVDYSPVSVEMSGRTNREDVAAGKMRILEGSVEHLPFADGMFDRIITVESFYFWPDPVANLREVRRVLKQGGTFLLVADIYQKEGLGEETLKNIRAYEMNNPTREEFREMLEQAGFSEIQIHTKEGTDWICVEGQV